jgi:vacuolar-type H+-ATPase subunit I/STV1
MDIKKQIRIALGLDKEEEAINLEFQAKLVDGTIIVSEADAMEVGIAISILAEDGTTMPLPVGNYETEDGVSFTVEEEGIVAEITEATEDEEEEDDLGYDDKEEMSEETENVEFDKEGLINEIGAVIQELLSEVKSDLERLDAELKEMRGENTDLKEMTEQLETEKAELENQVVELSSQPAEKPVEVSKFNEVKKNNVPSGDYNNMTRKEKFWYNLNKSKN